MAGDSQVDRAVHADAADCAVTRLALMYRPSDAARFADPARAGAPWPAESTATGP